MKISIRQFAYSAKLSLKETIIIISTLLVFTATNASANDKNVNDRALGKFSASFPNAKNVSWKITAEYSKATFMRNGRELSVFYDSEGNILGTSEHFAFENLPMNAISEINQRFHDYNVNEVIRLQTGDEWSYYISLSGPTETRILEVFPDGSITIYQSKKNNGTVF